MIYDLMIYDLGRAMETPGASGFRRGCCEPGTARGPLAPRLRLRAERRQIYC